MYLERGYLATGMKSGSKGYHLENPGCFLSEKGEWHSYMLWNGLTTGL